MRYCRQYANICTPLSPTPRAHLHSQDYPPAHQQAKLQNEQHSWTNASTWGHYFQNGDAGTAAPLVRPVQERQLQFRQYPLVNGLGKPNVMPGHVPLGPAPLNGVAPVERNPGDTPLSTSRSFGLLEGGDDAGPDLRPEGEYSITSPVKPRPAPPPRSLAVLYLQYARRSSRHRLLNASRPCL